MYKLKHIIFTALLISIGVFSYAQTISGASSSYQNQTKTYTLNTSYMYLSPNWVIGGGTLQSSSLSGTTYTAIVKWTTASSSNTVTFRNFATTIAQKTVNVGFPLLVAGSIGGTQTVCFNGGPSTLTNASSPSGGSGSYSYQWQNKNILLQSSWTNISGASASSFNPPSSNSNITRYYRRRVISSGQTKYSNTITVTVHSQLNAGAIAGTQTICYNYDAAALTSTANASGGDGSIGYQWYSRSSGGSWIAISGATATTYNPGNLTTDTEFQRWAISCAETNTSNIITVTVNTPLTVGTISGNVNICGTTSAVLLANSTVATGGDGTYSYTWWKRENGGSWIIINGKNMPAMTTADVLTTTEYQRRVSSCGATLSSNIITIGIDNAVPGTIVGQSDKYWSTATGQLALNGHIGTVQKWQFKDLNGIWADVPGSAAQNTINFTNLNETTEYKAIIGSVLGVCNTVITPVIQVVVTYSNFTGYITGPDQVIGLTNAGVLTLTGYDGSVEAWEYVDAGANMYSTTVTVSTSNTLSFTNLQQDRYYRAKLIYNGASAYTEWKRITVRKEPDGTLPEKLFVETEQIHDQLTDETAMDAATDLTRSFSYIDGLGRGVQNVVKSKSSAQNDIVSFQQYDEYGRSTKNYLPYTASGTDYYTDPVSGQATFYSTFYQGEVPYAETKLDNSPYQRVLEQGAVGTDWQLTTGNTVKYEITYNSVNEVHYWKTDGTSNSYYAPNTLVISIMTDENGHQVKTYTDSRGLRILKMVQEATSNYLSTYYIYDEIGKLVYTLPPKAIQAGILNANDAGLANLVFKYMYDSKGRLVEKIVPGATAQYIVYDQLERPILTQNGNLRAHNQWYFVKYDMQERIVYSGIYTNTNETTRSAVQTLFDALDYDNGDYYYEKTETNAAYHGYSNQSFPTTGLELLSINYYDSYNFDRTGDDDYSYDNAHFSTGQETSNTLFRGMYTGSKTKVLGTSDWLVSVVFYDDYGRAIQTISNNHKNLMIADKSSVIYKTNGEAEKVKSTVNDSTTTLDVINSYLYDHAGRVIEITQQNGLDAAQVIAHYTYNELGQQIRKELHDQGGGSYLQSVDFAYNIRGWLKSINDPDNITPNQLFGMELMYNETFGALGQTKAYNGNISAIKWKNNFTDQSKTQAYTYQYDNADRLKEAKYGEGVSFVGLANGFNLDNVGYDANGNITALQRKTTDATGITGLMDNLSYTLNGNRLDAVSDAASAEGFADDNAGTDYTYDANGNLITDANKDIQNIVYNVLNKPETIQFGDGAEIRYTYGATGNKLAQELYLADTLNKRTDYLKGAVYEDNQLQFFSHPEGRVVTNEAGEYEYQYNLTDHLGNVRTVFTSEPTTDTYLATMETENVGIGAEDLFTNLDATREVSTGANHTPGGNEAAELDDTKPVGPGIIIPVFPGDNLDVEVWGYYEGGSGYNTSTPAGMVAGIASAFGGINGGAGEIGAIYNGLNSALGVLGFGGTNDDTRPAAYLNYIVLDKEYQYLNDNAFGYVQMPKAASFNQQQMSLSGITIEKEGYIFVYVSYESEVNNRVFFDDLKVTHNQSKVIQCTNYYPFGLQHATSWMRATRIKNNRLYNGGSELNEQTNNYETFYRDYDPALGRFNQIDPLASKYSSLTPYNFAFNDPVFWNDPNGDDANREGNLWGDFWGALMEMLDGAGGLGGATWIYGGGWTSLSQNDAFYAGWNYNNNFNSWGYVKGGRGGAAKRFATSMGGTAYQDNSGNYNIVYTSNRSYVQTDDSGNPIENGMWGGTSSYDVLSLDGGAQNGGDCPTCPGGKSTSTSDAFIYGTAFKGGKKLLEGAGKEIGKQAAINKALNSATPHGIPIKVPKGVKFLGKFGGTAFTAWSVYDVEQQFKNGEINSYWRNAEQGSNAIGAIPVIGTGWSIGWEIGRWITQTDFYRYNVKGEYKCVTCPD